MIACDGAGACCPVPWVRQQRVKPYAIPFAIRSSEATYIGSFMGGPQLGSGARRGRLLHRLGPLGSRPAECPVAPPRRHPPQDAMSAFDPFRSLASFPTCAELYV